MSLPFALLHHPFIMRGEKIGFLLAFWKILCIISKVVLFYSWDLVNLLKVLNFLIIILILYFPPHASQFSYTIFVIIVPSLPCMCARIHARAHIHRCTKDPVVDKKINSKVVVISKIPVPKRGKMQKIAERLLNI